MWNKSLQFIAFLAPFPDGLEVKVGRLVEGGQDTKKCLKRKLARLQ